MATATLELPSPESAEQAKTAFQQLRRVHPRKSPAVTFDAGEAGNTISVVVPQAAFELFREVLRHIANGSAVTIVPMNAILTTQEAADFLNVSRPYLIGLLKAGKIPFDKVGAHRRIAFADLMRYKQENYVRRRAALDELTAEAQDLGLGY